MAPDRLAAFETVMGGTPRIWLAGILAYGISQILNVTIFTWLKRGGGRLLWLRSGVASVLSQIVDTLIFITVAFYGVFPIADLLLGPDAGQGGAVGDPGAAAGLCCSSRSAGASTRPAQPAFRGCRARPDLLETARESRGLISESVSNWQRPKTNSASR